MSDIPLREQIAAVERAHEREVMHRRKQVGRCPRGKLNAMAEEINRLAAALATLRGLLLIEETR